ncbi:MAG: hypothetical protein QM778_18490 [Myxococcales bacterium]
MTIGLGLWLALWKVDAVAALLAFVGSVLSVGKLSEHGAALGGVSFLVLGVALLLKFPAEESPSTPAEAMDRLVKRPVVMASAALLAAAVCIHGSRLGYLPGISSMEGYIWNPQFTVTLWVGFGAVLAGTHENWRIGALLGVSVLSALFVWVVRDDGIEAALAFCVSLSAIVSQFACLRLSASAGLRKAIVIHGVSLGASSSVAGSLLGALHGQPSVWISHTVVGIVAGAAVGWARGWQAVGGSWAP